MRGQTLKALAWAAAVALAMPAGGWAQTAPLKVLVGGAMTGPTRQVAADFAHATGQPVQVVSDTTGAIQKRLAGGETADIVIVTAPAMDSLQAKGLALAAGRTALARGLIGVGVKAGAASPDLSSAASFRAALVQARSVAYVNPAAGGTSGAYFEGLLKTMGIADVVRPKTVYETQGSEVAQAVASGRAEIGITFTSEMSPNPGVKVAGPLPKEIQSPAIYTAALTPSAGAAATALMQALKGPDSAAAIRKAGMDALATAP